MKINRQKIFDKTEGCCAYCGEELKSIKDMQVDHVVCQRNFEWYFKNGFIENNFSLNDEINLLASCRQCNFYKKTYSTEQFREELYLLRSRLQKVFIYKLSVKYWRIHEKTGEITFFFEKLGIEVPKMTEKFNNTYLFDPGEI